MKERRGCNRLNEAFQESLEVLVPDSVMASVCDSDADNRMF